MHLFQLTSNNYISFLPESCEFSKTFHHARDHHLEMRYFFDSFYYGKECSTFDFIVIKKFTCSFSTTEYLKITFLKIHLLN